MPEGEFRLYLEAARRAIAERRLGFADRYFFKVVEPEVVRRQRDGDIARPRERFELHLRLHVPLMNWYRSLERSLGGRVDWGLQPTLPAGAGGVSTDHHRYDLTAFDALVGSLPSA